MLRGRFEFAALPPDVRKGSAFTVKFTPKTVEAAPRLFGKGEAQPHESVERVTERQSLSAHRRAKPLKTSFA